MRTKQMRVTFEGDADARCVALAMIGQSDRVITRTCRLTTGQIQYRLRKAKDLMNNANGFRTRWRNGEGEVVRRIKRDMLAVLVADVQRDIPPRIIHPTPRTVKVE